jgi:hypothetical protein
MSDIVALRQGFSPRRLLSPKWLVNDKPFISNEFCGKEKLRTKTCAGYFMAVRACSEYCAALPAPLWTAHAMPYFSVGHGPNAQRGKGQQEVSDEN